MNIKEGLELIKKYNEDKFHIRHAITVAAVMNYFAKKLGYEDEIEKWTLIGMLHDVDFEKYPDLHCVKCVEILKENNVAEDVIHGVVCHAYGECTNVMPEHEMEKVLYATDELTGLIFATTLMRPSKSTKDLEVKSVKKKFKDKKFAAGCSRDVIKNGAEMLKWDLDKLIEETIEAMRASEDAIEEYMERIN